MPVLDALAPVFLLILLGYLIRWRRFVADGFWSAAEKLTYYIFFPALLLESMVNADLRIGDLMPLIAALAGGPGITAVLLLATRRLWTVDGPAFSSLFQGAIRPNTYVGLAAAASLFGPQGVTLAAIGIATVIPLVNVLAVIVVQRFGAGQDASPKQIAIGIASNPLIVSVLAGLILNLAGFGLPPVLGPLLGILGDVSLPLGLLAVGAGLDFGAVRRGIGRVTAGSTLKLVLVPGVTAALCLAFGVGGMPAAVAILYNGLPTSASSYVLARQLGGDSPLMAGIITATTIAAAATIPSLMLIFH